MMTGVGEGQRERGYFEDKSYPGGYHLLTWLLMSSISLLMSSPPVQMDLYEEQLVAVLEALGVVDCCPVDAPQSTRGDVAVESSKTNGHEPTFKVNKVYKLGCKWSDHFSS